MKWGIIGLDLIADEFIKKLKKLNLCYEIYCEDQTHNMSQKEDVKIYYKLEDLLKRQDIDIVYISTYLNLHQEYIEKALAYGKHVFCEKPMFRNKNDALRAYQIAKEKALWIGEANTLFYMPLYERLKGELYKIGKIKMIRAEFGSLKEEDCLSPIYQKELGGGALYDIGIYALTAVLNYMEGNVEEVKACHYQHKFDVDERWGILLKSDKQELASILLSIRNKLDKRFVIAGDQAYIEIMNYPRADKMKIIYPDMKTEIIEAGFTSDAVMYEIKTVEDQIAHGRIDNQNMLNTIKVMEIMDQLKGAC